MKEQCSTFARNCILNAFVPFEKRRRTGELRSHSLRPLHVAALWLIPFLFAEIFHRLRRCSVRWNVYVFNIRHVFNMHPLLSLGTTWSQWQFHPTSRRLENEWKTGHRSFFTTVRIGILILRGYKKLNNLIAQLPSVNLARFFMAWRCTCEGQ